MVNHIRKSTISRTLKTLALFSGLAWSASTVAAPPISEITFNNQTNLELRTVIGSMEGKGIPANARVSRPYDAISTGCFLAQNLPNCAINIHNKANNELVATVYMNAYTATLNQAPIFYGNYANQYEVIGWQASPLREITINAKA